MNVNSIGAFQLGNLLKQRIPFRILFTSPEVQTQLLSQLGPMERMHAKQWGLVLTDGAAVDVAVELALQLLQEVQTPFEFPVVIIDEDGVSAVSLQAALESAKYANAMFLQDGVKGFQV